MKTIDERIKVLEKKMGYVHGRVPGTQFTRTLHPVCGIVWTLSLGLMQEPKRFFVSNTIENCIARAEKEL